MLNPSHSNASAMKSTRAQQAKKTLVLTVLEIKHQQYHYRHCRVHLIDFTCLIVGYV